MRLILETEDQFNFEMDKGELTGIVDMTFLATKVAKELEVIHA